MSANDERISNQSMDLVEFNKERLLEMFPIFRTEGGGVDFDRLKLALGESVEVGKEVFGMRWPGKADSIRLANTPSHGTLSPDEKESVNFDTTQNLIIEGDNLEVLKLLQKSYQGKVKMIYIDPPYNTGNDFVYEDDFADGIKNYLQQTGQIDGEGNRLSTNSETDGRFHSNWLSMIYPRLTIARNLLSENGVVLISISDREHTNLKTVCNEIFGESNFLANFVWLNQEGGGGSDSSHIKTKHEYILCYANNIQLVSVSGLEVENQDSYSYEDEFVEERGPFKLIKLNSFSIQYSQSLDYEIIDQNGSVIVPSENGKRGCWRWSKKKFEWGLKSGFIVFKAGQDGLTKVYTKQYLHVDNEGKQITRTLPPNAVIKDFSTTRATKELEELLGPRIFDYSKPFGLIEFLVKIVAESSDLVVDFFAGSGTTAHAVMAQNAKDGGKRKFILVQLPEKVDPESEAAKAGFDSIADITKERVRRAGKKIIEESDGKLKLKGEDALDFGFRVLKLNESNIEDWNSEEASKSPKDLLDALKTTRLKSGRSERDVVFEVLVKYGIELTSSIEEQKVGKGSVWKIAGGELIVVVAPGLTNADLSAIVKMSPKVVVMLDEAFVPEALKTNARATFKDAKIELKTF